ncbi:RagB/SusD family nutrient uptake outer membrane protein [Botryobacter ruber]|uniref:RagB/SusD family nutrient uptake outer membrane protein n=1 Tax=Botryobacter ruber TaxID=2171629 RepID=UPI000E0CB687|nr:RagB/SusD family nutrient uptake outer membrane protein [Botryobacter ruber]
MKKIVKYTFVALSVSLFSACNDPETVPVQRVTEDIMWDQMDRNGQLAYWYVAEIYHHLPDGFNRINGDYLDTGTDEAIPSRRNVNPSVEFYNNGRVSVLNNPDPYWGNSYTGIRKVNLFLANVDKVPVHTDGSNAPERVFWKAEARFIRAMMYFELLKRYGGVPLVGDKVFTLQDNLELPRNTFEEVVNYIVSELDAVKDLLRKEPIADGFWGRIPRGAAIALKNRVYLYAASPLFNGGGISEDPQLKALTGYVNADPDRWDRVIQSAEEFMALGHYSLHPTFQGVFTAKKNNEVILQKQRGNNRWVEEDNSPVGYQSAQVRALGLTSPTQNFVNAFTDINGLPITDPASVYDPNNPYANRDPRFQESVFYNGVRWLNRPVETFDGGRDRPGGIQVQTRTGYYLRKFMGSFANSSAFSDQSHNFTIIRFAEILLNYAEALNEVGRTEEAVDQIKRIRQRAGIRAGTDSRYGIKAGISQSEMRDLIKNERRVELAFEEHRFWDLRRWKDAPEALDGPVQGVRITRNADGTFTYTYEDVANFVFTPKLYHMPLPFSEVTKNLNLIQNPGW